MRIEVAIATLMVCNSRDLGFADQPPGVSPRFWPPKPWANALRLIPKLTAARFRLNTKRQFCVAIILFFAVHRVFAETRFQGMSYTPWSENVLFSPASDQSIADMAALGVDTVALNFWAFQDDENSSSINLDFSRFSASYPSLEHAIEQIHSEGMQVLLKPNVDLRNGNWRGFINPSDSWFTGYTEFINGVADFAAENDVEVLSIGTEYRNTESWSQAWRNVAKSVRERFSGDIAYAANWDSYDNVDWWDALDYIGIDAYFPLTNSNNATVDELQTSWKTHADAIEDWLNADGYSQPVVFTEVGYRSLDGATRRPWEFNGGGDVDLEEQASAYEALLATMTQRAWWDGAFWWNWETDPSAGGDQSLGFTPQNKPAAEIVRRYYTGPTGHVDLNSDGSVDEIDWSLFLSGHKSDLTGLSVDAAFMRGDLNGDFVNDFRDFVIFETAFDTIHGAGALAALAAGVPEPTTWELLLWMAIPVVRVCRFRKRPALVQLDSPEIPPACPADRQVSRYEKRSV